MKVLIISHNPITTYQNMGKTLMSLFSNFNQMELCQLYIYPTIPDINKCNSYYRITDKDIIKSMPFKLAGGRVITKGEINSKNGMFENISDQAVYKSRHNHNPLLMMARDFAWKVSRWWTKQIVQWIEDENPDVIFVAPGRGGFLYDITFKISNTYNIPIVTYVCDDYYFLKNKKIVEGLFYGYLRNKIRKLLSRTSLMVGICDDITQKYVDVFDIPATTIMTGATIKISEEINVRDTPKSISYFGNIRCNRYISLANIGQALYNINQRYGTEYSLKVYTAETDKSILEHLSRIETIQLCGYVSGDDYNKEFFNSDILLHVEAFDSESIEKVRYSISTKIADSLASGIPLFAYGPEDVASIRYLLNSKSAIACTNTAELESCLQLLFNDIIARSRTTQNGLELATLNHSNSQNSTKLYSKIKDAII